MTDITELAQRMKTAAEKLDADQWQTRKGFSGIEVIVKGSLEKGHGCVSFQPVAADMADTKTARAIALFSPANVLALVEALEKAQQRIAELESRSVTVKLPKEHSATEFLFPVAVYSAQELTAALTQQGIKWEAE
ncbi:ead/Ea22-like family protein [Raoultella ornithinolytica]|uniref:ead/Ea22-like family protein n=1 Tax=Raoultella ornithinolytica TaxID=54291 RepID=UPI0015E135BA|nr:ead/Ea22-like family protein [Raoultella ornithinolytica]